MFRRTPRVLVRSLPALLLLNLGCGLFGGGGGGGGEEDPPKDTTAPTNVRITSGVTAGEVVTGQRKLQATADDDSGTVNKVEFYVDTTLACADGMGKASGSTFSCDWNASTLAQGSHQLTAKASDPAGNVTTSAAITFTSPAPNRVPAIDRVTATPSAINEGTETTLAVTANDPDSDPLTYSWTQMPAAPAGTFSGTGASRTWKAPLLSTNTTFTLKVTVADGKAGTAEAVVDVQVANVASSNRPPVVDAAISIPASVIAGDTANLTIGATDPDGDTLTYAWTMTAPAEGTFTNTNTSTAHWRSGDLGAAKTYSFQVTVSDGVDTVTRSKDMMVNVPQYARDIQPLWTSLCVSCHDNSASPRGGLSLQEGGSYASLVNKNGVGSCSPSPIRVKPSEPDNSYLVKKVSGSTCGGRMPANNRTYFDGAPGEVTRIRSWILAGAPNN